MSLPIGALGYAAASAAFFALLVLLVNGWRGRVHGAMLVFASGATSVWAGLQAYQAVVSPSPLLSAALFEVIRTLTWFMFLLVLLGYAPRNSASSPQYVRALALALLACGFILAGWTIADHASGGLTHHLVPGFAAGIIGHGIFAVIGMVLVEHLYRNTAPRQRWNIKYLCLGLGGLFAFDFYLYAEGMLFRRLNPDVWGARGFVTTLVAPFLAVAAARNPNWSLDVAVSRRVVFHSTALFGTGLYLLVMATAGYYIQYFGGSWGSILQTIFLFGAGLLLLLVMFSGTIRARLKVFVSKHFFSYRYDYREEWLKFTRMLSEGEPGVRLHERSIEAIAQLVESPGGGLWMQGESGTFEAVAQWNMAPMVAAEPGDSSFIRLMGQRQWVISLDEIDSNPEMYGAMQLPAWLRDIGRAWLVVPLMLHERLLGFVVLERSRAQVQFNWEVSDLLKTAGCQAASYPGQLQAARQLLQAQQFESFNRMSAFVVHDLKNLVAQLSLLLSNAERHRHNAEFQEDMLSTIANSVEKMNRLLRQLRSGVTPIEQPVPVSLDALLERAVSSKAHFAPRPKLVVADGTLSVSGHPDRLERVVGHLIQNAIEATPQSGQVSVSQFKEGGFAVIEVTDTGRGMSAEFVRDRLFRPFATTKATGMGIGAYESREYIRELGGRIEVDSVESKGTRFRVMLPLATPAVVKSPEMAIEGA